MMGRVRLAVLGKAPLRRLLAAQWASLSGDFAMLAALPFVVYSLDGGSGEVGVAFATAAASLVAFVIFGGVLADRHGRRRMMILADVLRLTTQGALAALLLLGVAAYWQVLVAEASIGAGAALAQPALTGLVAEIVATERRQGANALRGMIGSVAMASGPVLAGAALALSGPGAAVALDAASYAASAVLLIGIRVPRGGPGSATAGHATSFLGELRAGWSEFVGRTWLWATVLVFSAVNMLVFGPFEVLGAQTAHTSLGGAGAWSAILAAFGLGSVAGSFLALAWHPSRPLLVVALLLLAWVPLLVLLAATAPLGAILGATGITGAAWLLLTALWESTLQCQVPPGQLSRLASYDWLGSNAMLPVGLVLAAPLGTALGTDAALALSACVAVVACAAMVAVPAIRRMPRPADDEAAPAGGHTGRAGRLVT